MRSRSEAASAASLLSSSRATSAGGGGGRRPENLLQDPLPTLHRRCPVGVGRQREHARLGQHAAPSVVRKGNLPKRIARHPGDLVMPRQRLVDKGVVGVEQLEHAAVVPQDKREVLLGLLTHRLAQPVIETAEEVFIGSDRAQLAELQPLAGEVFHKLVGPRSASSRTTWPRRLALRLPARASREQLVVGHAAPEKIGEPAGQFEFGQRTI